MPSNEVSTTEFEDREVVKSVLAGQKDEFRRLVTRYQHYVYSLLVRQTGDTHLARDLAQEAFLKAYLHLKQFRFESSFKTWLIQIALNTSHSYYASRAFKEKLRTSELDTTEIQLPSREKEPGSYPDTLIEKVRLYIGTLKPHHRNVVVLCTMQNKTYKEAAEILGVPVGTVCSRMNKALQILRSKSFKR